jgi:hypothetical protein
MGKSKQARDEPPDNDIIKRSVIMTPETDALVNAVKEAQDLNFSAAIRLVIRNHAHLYARDRSGEATAGPGAEGKVYVDRQLWGVVESLARRLGMSPQDLVNKMVEESWKAWLARAEEREQLLAEAQRAAAGGKKG